MKEILVYGMTDNSGGIESYIMNMYRHINDSQLKFDFIAEWDKIAYEDEITECGSKIYRLKSKKRYPIKHLVEFYRVLKKNKQYKTVYFNVLNAGVAYSMVIPFLLRRKIVVHSHNGSDDNLKLHKTFVPLLNFFADKKLACSRLAAKYMFGEKAGSSNEVVIINNAISVDKFIFDSEKRIKKRQELGLTDEFTLLHVGRMSNQKNPMYLLDIFESIVTKKPDSVLLYVGVGEMENDVKTAAENKNIVKNIRFLGVRKDISELMQASDVFLLPSKYEGLPVVAVEAQAADLPCFMSDRISSEARLIDRVCFLSIETAPDIWADEILKSDISVRIDRSADITHAGYNIKNESHKLADILDV